jgi:hypothetical protein
MHTAAGQQKGGYYSGIVTINRPPLTGFGHRKLSLSWLLGAFVLLAMMLGNSRANAGILWSDLGATLVKENGMGSDILGGAVKRDDSASDTLYFKFQVDPLSDVSTEEYSAAFQFFEGQTPRLAGGNSLKAAILGACPYANARWLPLDRQR